MKIEKEQTLKELSSQELERLLREETRKDCPNSERVHCLLEALRERDHTACVPSAEQETAWEKFVQAQWECAEAPKPKTRRLIKWLAAAAAVICLLPVSALVIHAEYDYFSYWTEGNLWLSGHGKEQGDTFENYKFRTEIPELQQIYDEVCQEFGVLPVVPTWVPEGHTLRELTVTEYHKFHMVDALLQGYDGNVGLTFKKCEAESVTYYKDDMSPIVYEAAGVKHYLYTNAGRWNAVWMFEGMECSIGTTYSKETLCRIIDSIYGK